MGLFRGFRRPGSKFESGKLFKDLCVRAFRQCDVDNSGRIDVKELHIGLLLLYDKLNGLLPIHYPVPSKAEVGLLMRRFDVDASAELDFEEFYALARSQMGFGRREWYNAIWLRVLRRWALKAVVWPVAGHGVKQGLLAVGAPVAAVPTAITAYAVEAAVKSVVALC